MANIRDVAKKAGVSIATVSKILSGDPNFHVSEDTRKRVLEAVRELNYTYIEKKRPIRIGCIMSLTYSYSDPYFNDLMSGIQSYCSSHNALVSLVVSYAQFREMKDGLEKQLAQMDGLIITSWPEDKLDFIRQLKKQVVFMEHYVNGSCNVSYNEFYANQLVMDHIISCGYRHIAYIGGPMDYHDFEDSARMVVYRETLRKNKIPFNPELIYNCKWDSKLCAIQTRELLSRHPETQIIFAGSDSMAVVILSQLNYLGLRCPEDIGVIGFNDIELAQSFTPALTTLHLPSIEMGRTAAEVLIQQIKTNTPLNVQIVLPVELKIRNSTKKLK